MAKCHKCLIVASSSVDGKKQPICFAKCKSRFGRFILFTLLFSSVIITVVGAFLSMLLLTRYISNYFFVSNAITHITRVCGQSNNFNTCTRLMAGTPFTVSYVTIDTEDNAKKLATKLVEAKLAACVNIIPKVTSVYEWKGKVETDSEFLLMIKSRSSRLEEVTNFVRSNHPYEICEVISLPIQHGNQPYLDWLGSQVPDTSGDTNTPSGDSN